jgi:peptidylprolyl isomerase
MQITKGDTVKVHYIGTLENGDEFDNSYKREQPIEFEAGTGRMIKGFDEGIMEMSVGEKKMLKLTPEEAYGPRMERAIMPIPKDNFPPDFQINIGEMVEGTNDTGMPMRATVMGVDGDNIMLDFNHPLAGENLIFEVEIVDIQKNG